ncbi:MAG: succinylglutamate desuccinylase/aspartoacylase family protein [Hyphomicrobiales bacterium]
MKLNRIRGTVMLVIAGVVTILAAGEFVAMRQPLPISPGPGVTEVRPLSAYFPAIGGSRGDTEVYFLQGPDRGGTVLVLGGTHPNEPAGHVAAVILVEKAEVQAGRLIVIPRANASGFTHNDPQEANPQEFAIPTPSGMRRFRYGSRSTSPTDQWPDPDIYLHYPSGQTLAGNQTRNLNRAFPGRPNGNFTEQVAYAITEIVRREGVDLLIDLHEASPEYPVINAIVAHERAMPLAVNVVMGLELRDIKIGLEPSPQNLHGLTHREIGDHTEALAVLMETANPAQGRLRGKTSAELILTGRDRMYISAYGAKRLYVDFDDKGHPLAERVCRHLAGIDEFLKAFSEMMPDRAVVLRALPQPEEIRDRGIGAFLN